jgi:hypothetical protein
MRGGNGSTAPCVITVGTPLPYNLEKDDTNSIK